MEKEKIFKFYHMIGKLELQGLFIARESDVSNCLGQTIHIYGYDIELTNKNILFVSDFEDFVETAKEIFGGSSFGINPLDYTDDM